ncbi:hypothetical protein ABG067_006273 [Albugo candida]
MYDNNRSGRRMRHHLMTLERIYLDRIERAEHLYRALLEEEKRLEYQKASLESCEQTKDSKKGTEESKGGKDEAFMASNLNNGAGSHYPEAFVTSANAIEITPSSRPLPSHGIAGGSTIANTVQSTTSKADFISIGLILCVIPVVAIVGIFCLSRKRQRSFNIYN